MGRRKQGVAENIYHPSGPPEGAVDTGGGTATERATGTMVRGAARRGRAVAGGSGTDLGTALRGAGARVAQPGSSFAFTFLVGFAVGMVVVTFRLVSARLWVKRE